MYECIYCGTLADEEHTIEVGVNPDETVGLYDYEFVLCSTCEEKRQEGEEGAIRKAAKERARKLAREEEGVE